MPSLFYRDGGACDICKCTVHVLKNGTFSPGNSRPVKTNPKPVQLLLP